MNVFVDTLQAKKELVQGGLKESEAEAIVSVLSTANDQVATKKDLQVLESSLTVKLYTIGIAIVGVLAALKYWG